MDHDFSKPRPIADVLHDDRIVQFVLLGRPDERKLLALHADGTLSVVDVSHHWNHEKKVDEYVAFFTPVRIP